MTAIHDCHNSMTEGNSTRNESNNRTANTIGARTTLCREATVCREANNKLDTITISDKSIRSREASNRAGTHNYFEHWQQSSLQHQRHHRCQQQKGDASNSWHANNSTTISRDPNSNSIYGTQQLLLSIYVLKGGEKESKKKVEKCSWI